MSAVAALEHEEPRRTALVSTTPADLVRLAVERGADMSQIEKFMDLQQRWEAQEARKAYVAAMAAFKAEPIVIEKRKHVEFTTRDGDTTSYNHAELADVVNAVTPLLAKHGLSHSWVPTQDGGGVKVECVLTHSAGHSERISMNAPPDSSGKKNTIQQIASTTTYLSRYTLMMICGVAAQGMDDDARASESPPEPMSQDHAATLTALMQEAKADAQKFIATVCEFHKLQPVEHVGQLPDKVYAWAVSALNQKIRRSQGAAK